MLTKITATIRHSGSSVSPVTDTLILDGTPHLHDLTRFISVCSDNFIVFSGGMPRPSYADRHTVSVMQGAKQVVFDFTSRVVDFLVLSNADETDDLQHGGKSWHFQQIWNDSSLKFVL